MLYTDHKLFIARAKELLSNSDKCKEFTRLCKSDHLQKGVSK